MCVCLMLAAGTPRSMEFRTEAYANVPSRFALKNSTSARWEGANIALTLASHSPKVRKAGIGREYKINAENTPEGILSVRVCLLPPCWGQIV